MHQHSSAPYKLLWISEEAPIEQSKDAGGVLFSHYFNRFSADPRFEVSLIAMTTEEQWEQVCLEGEKPRSSYFRFQATPTVKKLLNVNAKLNPFHQRGGLVTHFTKKTVMDELRRRKKAGYQPDGVILEWTTMVALIDLIKELWPQAFYACAEHDLCFIAAQRHAQFYRGVKGAFWKMRAPQVKRAELTALRQADLVLPVNGDNKDVLVQEGILPERIAWYVPYFHDYGKVQRTPQQATLLFYGAMRRPENNLSVLWLIENVLSSMEDIPTLRLVIVGNQPPQSLLELESERIHVTGFVESVDPYFSEATCFVAPLVMGAGTKIKVLEAMSAGVPVITNSIGIEGIPATDGIEYFHCETPKEYENVLRSALAGEVDLEGVGQAGQRLIRQRYNPEAFLERYKQRLLD